MISTSSMHERPLKASGLRQPRGMECGGMWEGGSEWGDTYTPMADSY